MANISAYADIVRERAVVREMISVVNEIAEAGFDPQGRTSEDLLDLLNPASLYRLKVVQQRRRAEEMLMPDATVARIEQLFPAATVDGVTGVNTGYDDLNKPLACSRRI